MNATGMRIGLVGPAPPPNGGMAMQTLQLRRLLNAEGQDVTLLPTNPPYSPPWVGKLKGLRALFRLLPYCVAVWRLAGRVEVIHLMANSGWSWHLFAAPVLWLGRLRRTPVIVNYRGGEAGLFLNRSAFWVRLSLRLARTLVVPSGYLHQVFASHGYQCEVVPNIVDTQCFKPAAREAQASKANSFTFVITRNLEKIYAVDTALEAFSILRATCEEAAEARDIRLVVAGSGPEAAALREQAESLELGPSVQFLGRLDRSAIAALYRSADALLNPSTVDNMPNSVIEALASGVPVVSTDVGGVPFIIKHEETGLLVPAGDPGAMAGAMRRLLIDKNLYEHLLSAGLESVKGYTWQAVGDLWMTQYLRARDGAGSPVCF